MSSSEKLYRPNSLLHVGGFLDADKAPSFVMPVFVDNDHVFMQVENRDEYISGFSYCGERSEVEISEIQFVGKDCAYVGQRALLGFRFSENYTTVDTKRQLFTHVKAWLLRETDNISPFLRLDIMETCGSDVQEIKETVRDAFNLLSVRGLAQSRQWAEQQLRKIGCSFSDIDVAANKSVSVSADVAVGPALESASHDPKAHEDPFTLMLNEVRQRAGKNLEALHQMQREYVSVSAQTLSDVLVGGVDTSVHMNEIWFSTEEVVTTIARAIFMTAWGRNTDLGEAIHRITLLSPAHYWKATKDLALLMYASSSRSDRDLWEYIKYANQHLLLQSIAVIGSATSLSEAIQNLTVLYEQFSAREYFSELQKRAFQVYEERRREGNTYHDAREDWLRAEQDLLRAARKSSK